MARDKIAKVTEVNQPGKSALEAWHALIELTARKIATKRVSKQSSETQ